MRVKSISYQGPKIWDILPASFKESVSLNSFQKLVKKCPCPQACPYRLCKNYILGVCFVESLINYWSSNIFTPLVQLIFTVFMFFMAYLEPRLFVFTESDIGLLRRLGGTPCDNSWRFPFVYYNHKELHVMLQRCLIRLWFAGMLADWFLSAIFLHRDIEKLTGPLDHKRVFLDLNDFYFIFKCETVDLD